MRSKEEMQLDLMGLWLILDDASPEKDIMVSRAYVKEKIKRIANGTMCFHPEIARYLTKENYNRWIKNGRT